MTSSPSSRCLGPVYTAAAAEAAAAAGGRKRQRRSETAVQETTTPPMSQDRSTDPSTRTRNLRGTKNPLGPNERLGAYRLRLQTTPAQRRCLLEWVHAKRWAFNHMLHAVRAGGRPASEATVNALCAKRALPSRIARLHRCIYKNGMLDVRSALQGEWTKHRQDPRHHVNVNYQSLRRTLTETVRLDAAKFGPNDPQGRGKPKDRGPILEIVPPPTDGGGRRTRALVRFGGDMKALGPVAVRDRRWLVDRLTTERYVRHEAKLAWDKRQDALYLIVLLRVQRPDDPDPSHRDKRVVALDPGQRRFQTFVDMHTGCHGELLAGYAPQQRPRRSAAAELEARCRRIDRLHGAVYGDRARWVRRADPADPSSRLGRRARERRRRPTPVEAADDDPAMVRWLRQRSQQLRRQRRRLLGRCYVRLSHLKCDMHYAAIGLLWTHWDTVLVPTTNLAELCRRDRRPFGSQGARRALCWSHGQFRERLRSSAFRRAGKYVVETDEAYTTATCGACGALHPSVGPAKIFECPACGVRIDRDVNGARNIGLRYLTLQWGGGGGLGGGCETATPMMQD